MAKNSIGQFIAALRKANGMTQQNVADRLNVSNKAVSRWERDECAPDLSVIPALAEMFGVTCDELLKGERNRESDADGKKDIKFKKQVENLINSTLSRFKTMIWVSLLISFAGLICMFGISYGFYRNIIGFTVLLLFEACAAVIAIVAVSRAKDIKTDNELFEMADAAQITRFNNVLGSFSFWAFYTVFSVLLISLPFVLNSFNFVGFVIPIYSYSIVFLSVDVMIIILVYLKCRNPYMNWIANGCFPYNSKNIISVFSNKLTLVQIALTVFAVFAFLIAPYFKVAGGFISFLYEALNVFGIALMVASVVFFFVFILKHKQERSRYLLSGIRNIFLLPSALLASVSHTTEWRLAEHLKLYDVWRKEYLLYAVVYFAVVFILFSLIDAFVNYKRSEKRN